MEVCGTHTVSIFQSGLRSLLPDNIIHVSGPGCPVCVTDQSGVALFLQAARMENVIIATFGDLVRVPGTNGDSLKKAAAEGAHIEVIYSPLDALELARKNPDKEIIFPGIGFETTAPLVAAGIMQAARENLSNFSVISLHKLVPPALKMILGQEGDNIDAFLLPGHVATITGLSPFSFIPSKYSRPAVVGGFEPVDILLALLEMAESFMAGQPRLANAYKRAVAENGNPRARAIMEEVFEPADSDWRGLGSIPEGGLSICDKYARFDALRKFGLYAENARPIPGCCCGSVLMGRISPAECPLFGRACTPLNPVGPCMVSTEGSCAAHYKYGVN